MKVIEVKQAAIKKMIDIGTGYVVLEDYRACAQGVSNVYVVDYHFNPICTVDIPGNPTDNYSNIGLDGDKIKGFVGTGLLVTINPTTGKITDWVAVK